MGRVNKRCGLVLLLISLTIFTTAFGQRPAFEKETFLNHQRSRFGPNRKHFLHPFLAVSLPMALIQNEALKIKQPLSVQFDFGGRYKFKISKPLAAVAEAGINRASYSVIQDNKKTYPDSITHVSQSIRSTGPFGGILLRIRFGQPGDYLGNYLEIGIIASASLRNTLLTRDSEIFPASSTLTTNRAQVRILDEFNPLNLIFTTRMGFDRINLICSYRITRALSTESPVDLPSWQIGIGVSPVRY